MNYVVQLLGWLALQVVWQTLAVAFLLLLSLRLLRGASAARRYRCAELHLAGAAAAIVVSLIVSHASVAMTHTPAPADNARASSSRRWDDQAQPYLPAVAWTWLAGIAAAQTLLIVRFIRLRRFIRSTAPAAGALASMVEEMSFEIGLSHPPRVRCAEIHSPMVAGRGPGFLVVPRAFSETHPPDEMRALVAHELANILRRDYSRNALQLFAASLLWWHPGAWLIYGRIRHERECASDEHAVRLTGSAASLAKALFRLADPSIAAEPVAIRADSSRLVDRMLRISELPSPPARKTISPFLAGAFAALTIGIVTVSATASHGEALTRAYAASPAGPRMVVTIRAEDPAGTFLVKMVRGRVVAIELGQEPIPPERVVQRGDTVRVVGQAGQELLRLEIDPRGGFRWRARRAS
jgi:beta-lactamase regulating signal transducer with metallopeptidase domain